jgi:uncharacterized protein YkwD
MGNFQKKEEKIVVRARSRKPRKSIYENVELKEGLITEINSIRLIHQVPELIPSGDIDSIAQSFANKLAKKEKKGDLDYSNNRYKGSELGEILFYNEIGECDAETVIDSWYKDAKEFRYHNINQEATPFAQLVWKSSKLIGIGLSKDEKGGTYIVANFHPTGNVADQYKSNVFPPKGDIRDRSKRKTAQFTQFDLEALEAHNKYREIHHSPPLILNKELCNIASNYAQKLLQNNNGTIVYSFGKYKGNDMGENIFMCQGTEVTGEMATNDWYNEEKSYNYKKDYQKSSGHFTQIVWKDTKEVGFGMANRGNTYYVVANYYPPGNFLGQFSKNVLKP